MNFVAAITSIITGVCVGLVMILANRINDNSKKRRTEQVSDSAQVKANAKRIEELESSIAAQQAFDRAILGMVIIIGDGMIQSGVNGDVKIAFNQSKQDALKLL